MAFNYDSSLTTDKDWIRLTIDDTIDTSSSPGDLQDEEILAILDDEANKYYAAARCLSILQTRWAAAGGGLLTKKVSQLSKTWGIGEFAGEAITMRIKELRERGAFKLQPSPRLFVTLKSQ